MQKPIAESFMEEDYYKVSMYCLDEQVFKNLHKMKGSDVLMEQQM